MSPAKVTLSPKELELVTDASFILTKNAVIDKVYALFGVLSESYKEIYAPLEKQTGFPSAGSPKIARGEQYLGLPWVMLDQPRLFTKDDCFAIRSFFWWGNFCSITLLLSGFSQKAMAPALERYFSANENRQNWYLGIAADPWQHHFEENNYQLLSGLSNMAFTDLPYIKLARKIPLQQWEQLPHFFETAFREIVVMLRA